MEESRIDAEMTIAEMYRHLHEFDVALSKFHFRSKTNLVFTQYTLRLMDDLLGYSHCLTGFLDERPERTLIRSFINHGVNQEFAQKLHTAYFEGNELLRIDADQIILSRQPGYNKKTTYKFLFEKYGYTDFILQFVRCPQPNQDRFLSYYLVLSENRPFTDLDAECIKLLADSISVEQDLNFRKWDIINRNNMLFNMTNYYPVGIMIIENMNEVVFTNDIAKEYMEELGYPNEEYYGSFFAQNVYPYYQYEVLSVGQSQPIRISNFLFSVVPSGNPGSSLLNQQRLQEIGDVYGAASNRTGNASACVYILRDNEYHTRFSRAAMEYIGLTEREMEIAEMLGSGENNKDIADALSISANTVKIHINSILNKAGVNNRVKLISKMHDIDRILSSERL